MEYLEEQALEFANKYSKEHINEDVDIVALFEAFKQGAEYQREIDIEKACDWLESNAINYVGKDGIMNFRELYFDFIKAIEQ